MRLLVGDLSFAWIVPLSLAIAFLPVGWRFSVFEVADSARQFLSTMWQVEAATFGLSIAVVLFVFQAIYASAGFWSTLMGTILDEGASAAPRGSRSVGITYTVRLDGETETQAHAPGSRGPERD